MTKKKSSASSRPAKQTSVSAEFIFSKPVSKTQKAVLSRIAKRQAGDDSSIDYSDIPPLTDEQLTQFRVDGGRSKSGIPPGVSDPADSAF